MGILLHRLRNRLWWLLSHTFTRNQKWSRCYHVLWSSTTAALTSTAHWETLEVAHTLENDKPPESHPQADPKSKSIFPRSMLCMRPYSTLLPIAPSSSSENNGADRRTFARARVPSTQLVRQQDLPPSSPPHAFHHVSPYPHPRSH